MKAIILPENVLPYTQLLGRVLPSHTQVPILANILIEAKEDGLYLTATDLELGVEIKIPAKIEEIGSITIPGKEFLETLNSLPKEKIELSLEKDLLTLVCRDIKVKFNTINAQEFPQLYKSKGTLMGEFLMEEFIETFSNLVFSVSQEQSRPQLNGVFVDGKDDGVNFVSTDGYRMSVRKTQSGKGIEGQIVSVDLINEVMSLKSPDPVRMLSNKEESQLNLVVGNVMLVGRIIDGQFPDYAKVLPKDSKTVIEFDREEMLSAVKLTSVFAKEGNNIVSLAASDQSIKLSTQSHGLGKGEAMVDCKKEGDDAVIAFNIKYLMDFLKNIKDNRVVLKLNSSMEPALFETKGGQFKHVIMPVQVD